MHLHRLTYVSCEKIFLIFTYVKFENNVSEMLDTWQLNVFFRDVWPVAVRCVSVEENYKLNVCTSGIVTIILKSVIVSLINDVVLYMNLFRQKDKHQYNARS